MFTFRIRHLAVLSLSALLIAAGCGSNSNSANNAGSTGANANPGPSTVETSSAAPDKLKIKVSFYPMYEFTKNIVGDLADVETLVPAGIEPHDWEPTARDMAAITGADVFVYNGAGMEAWAEQVLDSASGSKLVAVEASKGLEIMEGTEEEEAHTEGEADDHDHAEEDHEHADEAHAEEEPGHDHDHGGLDPHVWLAPALAIQEVRTIEAALSAASPENAAAFHTNADSYVAKLEHLDQDFKDGLAGTKRTDFITQHAAFGYLAKEYGLTQVPIAGLSPDQEPSAAQMAEVVEFAKAHVVKTIFFETLVSSSVADTIAQEIGAKAAVLNPIEGLTDEERSNNLDYAAIMHQNLEALKTALNE
ncbi:High-affinity zinc uptake system binding-protein ZnuA [Paenibacillus auburnensis]|uniref:High-affinity zinc uptake system binding-protein ZnuA n=1 Tax=Paenibacillus auburnensis TaxID=2905649 RepID=A0ABN8FUB8_9BACL|nr:metal ABC transporter substrate-binding protein [Paenibacillus auburnensis]CAH1190167.1 High-affinity zinc uptake system binding-protein ZnuA [Paenibacillus auburnensis]